jgi:signal transduction histidine kinase
MTGHSNDLITPMSVAAPPARAVATSSPLAGLRALVEAIDEGVVADAPTLRRYVAEMRRAVDSLTRLLDDLFELARVGAGAIERETRRVRLEDVVRSAVAEVEGQAKGKGLAVETALEGAGDVMISPRLLRVVQNLLHHAVRHTPADGTVRVEAVREAGGLRLAVEDTGEGIAPEALPHVFERFRQGDPDLPSGQGVVGNLGELCRPPLERINDGRPAGQRFPSANPA